MPASRSVRTTRALLIAIVVAAGSVACAPDGDGQGDTQTVADACATLSDAVDEAMSAFAETDAADTAATASATAAVRDRLGTAVRSIGNGRVEAIATDLRAGFDALTAASAAAADGDVAAPTGLAQATDRIRTAVAQYHDLCGR